MSDSFDPVFKHLVDHLTDVYYNLLVDWLHYGQSVPTYWWGTLERAIRQTLQWGDVAAGARMRWKAHRTRTKIPKWNLETVIDANPWLQDHVAMSDPLIQWRARKTAEIEREYLARLAMARSLRYMPAAIAKMPQLAMHRLGLIRTNALGDVVNTSEQIELAVPSVGDAFPFCQILTREDARVRPTHAAAYGMVALRSWQHWPTCRPLLGFRCRCYTVYRTRTQAIERGWMTKSGKPKFEVHWPNSASEENFKRGLLYKHAQRQSEIPIGDRYRVWPDPGWMGPKYWSFPPPAQEQHKPIKAA